MSQHEELHSPLEELTAQLGSQLGALEQKEDYAFRRRSASEDIMDGAYKVAVQVDRKKLDPVLMVRALNLVEDQYFSSNGRYTRWGQALDPTTNRRVRDLMDGGRSFMQDKRAGLLEDFAQSPEDDSVWEAAYRWIEAEKDKPARWPARPETLRPTIADDIPGEELIALAKRVRDTPAGERYGLMTQEASNGKTWFDVLESFSSHQIERDEATAIDDLFGDKKVEVALDIGTGTGKSLDKLASHAEKVVGLDRNSVLLHQAQKVRGNEIDFVQASADAFPLKDASVDIASSTGITGAINAKTAEGFYSEIARVLKPGGVYVDGVYHNNAGYVGEELNRINATSKAMLADMIVDTVSAKFEIDEHQSAEQRAALLGRIGLHEEVLLVSPSPHGTVKAQSKVTVLTKSR